MTFNLKSRMNNSLTPLLVDDVIQSELQIIFQQIESGFLDINKDYNDIKEFNRKIPTLTRKEYEKVKDDIHAKIQMIPNILKNINQNYDEITGKKFSTDLSEEMRQKLEIIKEKLNTRVTDFPNLINQIFEREKIVSLKLRNIKISEVDLDDSLSIIHNRSDNLRDSRLVLKEVIENQAYLEKRREELESIKKVTAQLKEITVMMGQEVKMQGEQLNMILDDIELAKSNVQMAESLVSEAKRNSRKQMKKIILMVLTIVLIVAVIISVVLVISLGK